MKSEWSCFLALSLMVACEASPPEPPAAVTQMTQPTPAHAAPPPQQGPPPAHAGPESTGLQHRAQLVDQHHIQGLAAIDRYLASGDTADLRQASEELLQAIPTDNRPGADRHGRSPEQLLRVQKSLMFYAWTQDQLGDPGPRRWLEDESIFSAEAFDFFFESQPLEEVLGWVMLLDCQDNLAAIGAALASWAQAHDGLYPERLEDLVPEHLPRLPTCASTGTCSYCDSYHSEEDGRGFQLVCDQHLRPAGPPLAIAAGQQGGAPMDPILEQRFKIFTMLTGGYTDTHRLDQHLPHLIAGAAMEPGDVVADIGAGPGLFTLPFAEQVGSGGRVWAVDINASVLSYVEFRAQRRGLPVTTVLAVKTDCGLEDESLDSALVIQTYHAMLDLQRPGDEANYQRKVKPWLESILLALRPGGRLVVQDTDLPADLIKRQVGEAGFDFVEQKRLQGQDLLLVFTRPG